MKKMVARFAGLFLVVLAITSVTTASTFVFHRPEIPAELLEE